MLVFPPLDEDEDEDEEEEEEEPFTLCSVLEETAAIFPRSPSIDTYFCSGLFCTTHSKQPEDKTFLFSVLLPGYSVLVSSGFDFHDQLGVFSYSI